MVRPWRGARLEIEIARGIPAGGGDVSLTVDGIPLATNILAPPVRAGGVRRVVVAVR
jgi:hypothetical protein